MQVEPNVSGEKSPLDEFLEPTRLLGLALIVLTLKVSRHLRTRWAAKKEPRLARRGYAGDEPEERAGE